MSVGVCSFVAKIQDLDIPLPRNQNLIVKSLMAHRRKVIDVAHFSEAVDERVAQRRHDLLESTNVCSKLVNGYNL